MLVEIISIVKHTSLINIDICKAGSQPLQSRVPKVFRSDRRKQIAQILD